MRTTRTLAPGTIVKLKGKTLGYSNPLAIVIEHQPGGAVFLQTEGSDRACVARWEVSVVRDPPAVPLKFLRHKLPYGKWTCPDGREVLFNRNYKPIWQRSPGKSAQPADPTERVPFERQEWFYEDKNQPWRDASTAQKCNRVLAEWNAPLV